MVKFRIALDFDNVLANTTQRVLEILKERHNKDYDMDQMTRYELHKIVLLSEAETWECFLSSWDDITKLKPIYHYQMKTLHKYMTLNHNLSIVSSCGKPIIKDWLDHWGYINDNPIIYSEPGVDKNLNEFDILIDDNPYHLEKFHKDDPAHEAILFSRPWNKDFDYLLIERCNTPLDIFKRLRYLERINKQGS